MAFQRAILAFVVALATHRAEAQSFPGLRVSSERGPFEFSENGEDTEGEPDEIETDRDSFTPATTTAGPGRLILETAYSFIDNRAVPETHSFPELLGRYGVADWLELRLGWNYEVGGASNTVSGSAGGDDFLEEPTVEEESQLSYGAKVYLSNQEVWLPQSAVIVAAGTPTSGKETATQLVTTYVFGWQFANDWKWDSAIRYGYDSAEGDHFNVWAPSSVLKVPLIEHWVAHAEYFGAFTDGRESERVLHYVSPGVHYLVTPDFEIGVRVGWGLNDQAANFFSNAGLGLRF
jgi:hypothetical protein